MDTFEVTLMSDDNSVIFFRVSANTKFEAMNIAQEQNRGWIAIEATLIYRRYSDV